MPNRKGCWNEQGGELKILQNLINWGHRGGVVGKLLKKFNSWGGVEEILFDTLK